MTFVLNILHNDFTILAADKLATSDTPGTVKMGNITVHHGGNLTINGLLKYALSKQNDLAVGIAGTTGAHSYFTEIADTDLNECLTKISKTISEKFASSERSEITADTSFTLAEGIATFYDEHLMAFLSLYYSFCEIQNFARWYRASSKSRLIHIGSGSTKFEDAVGLEEINNFIDRLNDGCPLSEIMDWIRRAFEKVSKIDDGVSDNFNAVISTRAHPEFVRVDQKIN